jgi:tripartite-type tricarboxylate transporter receptor subunit TctC
MRNRHSWLLALLLMVAPSVLAQNYPSKPIRFIVPYAPGGSSDILARLFGQQLSESLGQTLVVDNRPGAGSVIGTAILAKSAPDGYTIILSDMPHTINPAVYGKVPYDPVEDFTPITLVARAPMWLFLNPSVPAKTVGEFVALAKAQPAKFAIGSGGNGTNTHLLAELLQRGAGIKLIHVPFKGAGPSIAAVVAGEVHASFTSMPAAAPFVQSGRLRAVGVSTAARHPAFPEVPTFAESGIPNMVLHHWWGVLAPAGLPKPVQMKLHREFVNAVNLPAIRERYKTLIIEAATTSPEEFKTLLATDLKRWGKVVKDAGIHVQ